jgi:hypothetical protein
MQEAVMRTTLSIDDDVLAAAKVLARQQHKTIGEVVTDLARQSLRRPVPSWQRDGIPLLPVSNAEAVVALDVVRALTS